MEFFFRDSADPLAIVKTLRHFSSQIVEECFQRGQPCIASVGGTTPLLLEVIEEVTNDFMINSFAGQRINLNLQVIGTEPQKQLYRIPVCQNGVFTKPFFIGQKLNKKLADIV